MQAIAIGLSIAAYPVFLDSIETDLGATRTATSFGIPLIVGSGAVIAPFVGRAVDRGSPRRVMLFGAALMCVGLLALSAAPDLGWAAAAWVGLVGPGQTLLGPIPAMTVLANWFVERRATMIAVAAMGTTFGAGIVPPIAEWLIRSAGWRGAVLWMGLATIALALPMVLLGIRKRPEDIGAYPDGASEAPPVDPIGSDGGSVSEILGDPRFWPVAASFASLIGLGIAYTTHLMPLSAEKGIAREVAVFVLSVCAAGSMLGKLVFGALTDRLGPKRAVFVAVGIQLLAWAGLAFSNGPISFGASAALFAFGIGCTVPVQAGFVATLFGRSHFGRATGLLGLFALFGIFGLAPLIGWGYETTGSYDVPMKAAMLAVLLPAVMLAFLRLEPPRRARGG